MLPVRQILKGIAIFSVIAVILLVVVMWVADIVSPWKTTGNIRIETVNQQYKDYAVASYNDAEFIYALLQLTGTTLDSNKIRAIHKILVDDEPEGRNWEELHIHDKHNKFLVRHIYSLKNDTLEEHWSNAPMYQ
ncbi:MAG: hypothetical protein R2800_02625 [Flavipsychrobacter sp.]